MSGKNEDGNMDLYPKKQVSVLGGGCMNSEQSIELDLRAMSLR